MTTEIANTASLTAEIMNPILEATFELFETMLGCVARRRGFDIVTDRAPLYPVSAFIRLSGVATGLVVLTMPRRTAFGAVYRILEERSTEVNSLVVDTVGEFTNIIAGNARTRLDSMRLEMGLPEIVIEGNRLLHCPRELNPMLLTFDSEIGPFSLIFSLAHNSSVQAPTGHTKQPSMNNDECTSKETVLATA